MKKVNDETEGTTSRGLDISGLMRDEFIVELPFDEEAGSFVGIKHISREDLLALRKKATVKVLDTKTRQMVEQVDTVKADLLLCREVVRSLRGFNVGGEDYPCTPANAEFLMRKWSRFAKFVNDSCDDLDLLQEAERAALGKK